MIYLTFDLRGKSASGKTSVWLVNNLAGETLGMIRWSGPWRRYVLRTISGCDFDGNYLREIAEFCKNRTEEHKERE